MYIYKGGCCHKFLLYILVVISKQIIVSLDNFVIFQFDFHVKLLREFNQIGGLCTPIIHCVKGKNTQGSSCPFLFSFSFRSFIFSFFSMWTWEVARAVGATNTIPITIGAWNFNQTSGIINKKEGGEGPPHHHRHDDDDVA